MIAEAALWTIAALVAPELLGLVLGRWRRGAGGRPGSFAHGVLSLGIPYLALMTGALAARDVGLSGQSATEWIRGGLVCAGVLALAWVAAGWRGRAVTYARPAEAAVDEPRWALYRGMGSLLADPHWAGPLIGLGLGLTEWTLAYQPWLRGFRWPTPAWTKLVRVCGSTALFLLTRNLWLIVLTQVGLSLILVGRPRETPEGQA